MITNLRMELFQALVYSVYNKQRILQEERVMVARCLVDQSPAVTQIPSLPHTDAGWDEPFGRSGKGQMSTCK